MPQKGLNIPNSYYDIILQEKLYLKFIKKAEKVIRWYRIKFYPRWQYSFKNKINV